MSLAGRGGIAGLHRLCQFHNRVVCTVTVNSQGEKARRQVALTFTVADTKLPMLTGRYVVFQATAATFPYRWRDAAGNVRPGRMIMDRTIIRGLSMQPTERSGED